MLLRRVWLLKPRRKKMGRFSVTEGLLVEKEVGAPGVFLPALPKATLKSRRVNKHLLPQPFRRTLPRERRRL
jgi:hypothetical protein